MICTLCESKTTLFSEYQKRAFYVCDNCEIILLHPKFYLNKNEEKGRYDLHSDDILAPGYQKFVSPLVQGVIENFTPNHKGLDFGCGKTEIVKYVLTQKGYNIKGYDPFYFDNKALLKEDYDYITSCEVIEHLYTPKKDFQVLFNRLQPEGKLFLKTSLYDPAINFENWWYKNDPTHVSLYTKKSLEYIRDYYGFSSLQIFEKHIVLSK